MILLLFLTDNPSHYFNQTFFYVRCHLVNIKKQNGIVQILKDLYHKFRELILYGIIGCFCAGLDFFIYTVHYLFRLGTDEDSMMVYINSLYDGDWPEKLFIAGTHLSPSYRVLVDAFEPKGYQIDEMYNNHEELLFLSK